MAWGQRRLDDMAEAFVARRRGIRRLSARRRLRSSLAELFCAGVGLALGLALPRLRWGPSMQSGRVAELLFTLGFGILGVVSIVFSLLFGVVQWSASTFTPRLSMFRGDPLVWRTFAVAIGAFVFCVTAGGAVGTDGHVSTLVPVTAVGAVLLSFALIRALQARAFLTLQLAHVLQAVAERGNRVIAERYPQPFAPKSHEPRAPIGSKPRRAVTWKGTAGIVQQLDLRRLVDEAARTNAVVIFRIGVGDPVRFGTPLADVLGGELSDDFVREAVLSAAERSFDQDPALALRLLADIELRALSPAINDPATAVDALNASEDLLCALVTRELDAADIADSSGVTRVQLRLPSWEEFLVISVEDLLPWAAPFAMVLARIRRLLDSLRELAPQDRQASLTRLDEWVGAALRAAAPLNVPPPSPPDGEFTSATRSGN